MTVVTWLYNIKYITNTDKIQIFNYKIMYIKDNNHRSLFPSNVSSICIQHFKPSMP